MGNEDQLHDIVSAAGALARALEAVDPSELPAGASDGLQAMQGSFLGLLDAEAALCDAEQAVAGAGVHLLLEVLRPGVTLVPEALAAVEAFRQRVQVAGLAVA